ncbi:hypothetical protein E3P77_03629 [Wallemia ichthyophaga]|nr:hypothetical protein E3P77_03629 [Wallemia ichthyophaga]
MHRLIVCIDGSWDDSTSTPNHSNIVHLLRSIETIDKRTQPSVMQYAQYRTAHFSSSLLSQLLGVAYQSFSNCLFELYAFLCMNYSEDGKDEIFLLGYSKGAYVARILAAVINEIGILPRDQLRRFFPILKAFFERKRGGKVASEAEEVLKPWLLSSPSNTRHLEQQFIIKCLALFDCTVKPSPSLPGITSKFNSILTRPESYFGLPDALLGQRIQHCYHAMALNENRANQRELRLELLRGSEDMGQKCKQVWFTGSSGDIGGSYSMKELSDISRMWIASQINPLISLNKEVLMEQLAMPVFRYAIQPPHNPYTSKLTTLMPVKRKPKLIEGGTERIHSSVLLGSPDLAEPVIAAIEKNSNLIEELSELEDEFMREWTVTDSRDTDDLEITYALDIKHYNEEESESWVRKMLYTLQLVVAYVIVSLLRRAGMLFGFNIQRL